MARDLIEFTFDIDNEDVVLKALGRASREVLQDMSWMERPSMDTLQSLMKKEFKSQGRVPWDALSPRYARWKDSMKSRGLAIGGGNQIGVFKGFLKKAATTRGTTGNIAAIKKAVGRLHVEWGVDGSTIPHAIDFNSKRQFARILPEDEVRFARIMVSLLLRQLFTVASHAMDVEEKRTV